MLFNYKNVDFDIDENQISEERAKEIGNLIIDSANSSNAEIYEINIEDETFFCVYLEKKGNKNEWDKETNDFVENLQNKTDFSVMYADEDYGDCFDVIVIHNE